MPIFLHYIIDLFSSENGLVVLHCCSSVISFTSTIYLSTEMHLLLCFLHLFSTCHIFLLLELKIDSASLLASVRLTSAYKVILLLFTTILCKISSGLNRNVGFFLLIFFYAYFLSFLFLRIFFSFLNIISTLYKKTGFTNVL